MGSLTSHTHSPQNEMVLESTVTKMGSTEDHTFSARL